MRILGIDPGTTSMGYAVLEEQRSELAVITYGTTAITEKQLPERLVRIGATVRSLIAAHAPEVAGVEKLFFAKNKKTALEVAQARGVIVSAVLEHSLPLHEFTPAQVKIAVTNYGSSDKQMVLKMVRSILKLSSFEGDDNAADALAVAIATAGAVRAQSIHS